MTARVVDASVAIKWLLPEDHSEAARRLLTEKYALSAPDLLFAEVGNVLWGRVRWKELTVERAGLLVASLAAAPLEVHGSASLVPAALDLAVETGVTVYDALYVCLAGVRGPLVTADKKLIARLRRSRYEDRLQFVEDVS